MLQGTQPEKDGTLVARGKNPVLPMYHPYRIKAGIPPFFLYFRSIIDIPA
jgi:hypothetical protein